MNQLEEFMHRGRLNFPRGCFHRGRLIDPDCRPRTYIRYNRNSLICAVSLVFGTEPCQTVDLDVIAEHIITEYERLARTNNALHGDAVSFPKRMGFGDNSSESPERLVPI